PEVTIGASFKVLTWRRGGQSSYGRINHLLPPRSALRERLLPVGRRGGVTRAGGVCFQACPLIAHCDLAPIEYRSDPPVGLGGGSAGHNVESTQHARNVFIVQAALCRGSPRELLERADVVVIFRVRP